MLFHQIMMILNTPKDTNYIVLHHYSYSANSEYISTTDITIDTQGNLVFHMRTDYPTTTKRKKLSAEEFAELKNLTAALPQKSMEYTREERDNPSEIRFDTKMYTFNFLNPPEQLRAITKFFEEIERKFN